MKALGHLLSERLPEWAMRLAWRVRVSTDCRLTVEQVAVSLPQSSEPQAERVTETQAEPVVESQAERGVQGASKADDGIPGKAGGQSAGKADYGITSGAGNRVAGRAIPSGQEPGPSYTSKLSLLPPGMTVAQAVRLLLENNFSQVPVVEGQAVLGVFSFRSLARRLLRMQTLPQDLGELPVDEFREQFHFVQQADNWEEILDDLGRDDGVLVGHKEMLQGILTPMDVLLYLRDIASPFVMLAEIELSLRRIIQGCVSEAELQSCIATSLSSKYRPEELPENLSDMTFNDYVQIIERSDNWLHFCRCPWAGRVVTKRDIEATETGPRSAK